MSAPVIHNNQSAEKDAFGREYLEKEQWQKMGTQTVSSKASAYLDKMIRKVTGDLEGEDLTRVLWLSSTLFFIVGGYWLLRSLKDPIMSVINGVRSLMPYVIFSNILTIICLCRWNTSPRLRLRRYLSCLVWLLFVSEILHLSSTHLVEN